MKSHDLGIGTVAKHPLSDRAAIDLEPERFCLEKGEVIRVEPTSARRRIECRSGRLWITQTGLGGDIILKAGDAFESSQAGRLVVEALEPACATQAPGIGVD